ncbi:MAG: hypothetical protein K2P10_07490 [Oscillospiraceae bacterium]|nr:hypothetical protein [Oscillospiraceae bacterium]
MELRMSSIPLMLEYVSGLASHPGDRETVRQIFAHEDYQFELRRYEISSTEHLVDYFSRLNTIAPEDIPDLGSGYRRNHLREKHGQWLDCADNPQKYADRFERLRAFFTDDFLAEMQEKLTAMFPRGTEMLPDPAVVSTLSFGRSFGYPHEGAIHLDLFGIDKYCSLEDLPRIVLHEMHHLQLVKMAEGISGEQSLLDQYIQSFAGEGLAVKFCNNAEGVISRRIEPDRPPNLGVPSIPLLNGHFQEHFQLFCDTVGRIRSGEFSEEDMARQQREVWMNPYLYGGSPLDQLAIYSFGNELYGCVYDHFGLDETYECFYHPARLIGDFNLADCGWTIP